MPISVHDIAEQLSWHWTAQLRPRLGGLSDAEYFWEPVEGMWSIRPVGDRFDCDWAHPPPDPQPATTIAWRLGHIWMTLAQRSDFHFGTRTLTTDRLDWPGTARAALTSLDEAFAAWATGVSALTADTAERRSAGPPGTADGRFPLWAVVLHVNREVIHHGAEVAVLRDLYAARFDRTLR